MAMKTTRLFLVLSLVLASMASGCAGQDAETSGVGAPDGKADAFGGGADAATRAAIIAAIHRDYLDGVVHGQAAEIVVSSLRVAGQYAWATGTVQAVGGGDIDWANSDFAQDIQEGLFDGPNLQSLLRYEGDQWNGVESAIGSTDVWWDGLWLRYPIPCELLPEFDSCLSVREPAAGTAERSDIMEAIHTDFLDAALHGQDNELVVRRIRVGGNYAFVDATVQAPGGGEIDWANSDFAQDVEDGLFDGPSVQAFLSEGRMSYVVLASGVGSTDVWWDGIWNQYEAVPCALFNVNACD